DMSYMLLIVEPPEQRRERGEALGRQLQARMNTFANELRSRGVLLATDSLRSDAVRVSASQGKQTITDGPFAEAKELIGGYFLLAWGDSSQALAIARECPAVEWGTVEVREIGPCYT